MAPPKISKNVLDVFTYDPDTGYILKDGVKVGSPSGHGYIYVTQGRGRKYLAHRLAWYIYYGEWPNGVLDHINRDKTDNRISNLRDTTQSINLLNQGKCFSGIYRHRNKWRVRVGRYGECGSFYCFGEALKARNKKVKGITEGALDFDLDSYTLKVVEGPKEPKTENKGDF